jgi:Primase C terminal 2 (PriCT-2)
VHTFLGDNRKVANGYHFESSSDLRGTVEAVTDALRFIANADLAYGVWIRMGMAIRGALGEDGGAVFADWSATSSKDVPSTTADAWRRFKPTRIGAGTIYHEARLAGWIPAPTIALNHNGDGAHPAQALLDKLKETRL